MSELKSSSKTLTLNEELSIDIRYADDRYSVNCNNIRKALNINS